MKGNVKLCFDHTSNCDTAHHRGKTEEGKAILFQATVAYWMSGGTACTILGLALDGGERSTSCLCCFIPGEKHLVPTEKEAG